MLGSRQEPPSPSWPHLAWWRRMAKFDLLVTNPPWWGWLLLTRVLCPAWGLLLPCDGCCSAIEGGRLWCWPPHEPMSHRSSTRVRAQRTRLGVVDLRPGGALLFYQSLPWAGWSRASRLWFGANWSSGAPHPSEGCGSRSWSSRAGLLGPTFCGHALQEMCHPMMFIAWH
jgi:hypothetical protein